VKSKLIGLVVILLVCVAGLIYILTKPDSVDAFLEHHWAYPVPAQGKPPASFSPLEASLDPASCGECHADQFAQWRSSLHSHTMGPGIRWQLQIADMKTAQSCLRCHAPMTEQLALLSQQRGWSKTNSAPPEYIPKNLHQQGLVCVACHVRAHTRHGPTASKLDADRHVHGGFEEHQAFSDSRFCANCHQFAKDGPRINGKLRENTYQEWLATDFAKQGQNCQSCHMPQRQHIWRGIHDAEMTRSALTIELSAEPDANGAYQMQAAVTNSGAGHYFPTYMVPEIVLHLEVLDTHKQVRELARQVVAWRSNLALTEEIFDQRLAAGETLKLNGELQNTGQYRQLRLRISVAPRQHYVRTFEDYLKHNQHQLQSDTLALLHESIREAKSVEYEFIAAELSLARIAN